MTLRLSEKQYAALLNAHAQAPAALPLAVHAQTPLVAAVRSPLVAAVSKAGAAHAAPVSILTTLKTVSAAILIAGISTAVICWYVFPALTGAVLLTIGAVGLVSRKALWGILATLAGLWTAVAGILAVLGLFAFASSGVGLVAAIIVLLRFAHH
jgi:hypothetical protein